MLQVFYIDIKLAHDEKNYSVCEVQMVIREVFENVISRLNELLSTISLSNKKIAQKDTLSRYKNLTVCQFSDINDLKFEF